MVRPALGAMVLLLLAVPHSALAEACAARLAPVAGMPAGSRDATARDLIELREFGPAHDAAGGDQMLSLSPNGTQAALVLRRADTATNSYCFGIVIVTVASGERRLIPIGGEPMLGRYDLRGLADLPSGMIESPPPKWSPDGRTLAFMRRSGGVNQLWELDVASGAQRQVTHEALDVRAFAWSPDGGAFVFTVRAGLAQAMAAIDEEGASGFLFDGRFWPVDGNRPLPSADAAMGFRVIDRATGAVGEASEMQRGLLAAARDPRLPAGAGIRALAGANLAWVAPRDPGRYQAPSELVARVGERLIHCGGDACADRVIGLWWRGPGELLFLRDWTDRKKGLLEFFRWRPGSAPVSLYATTDLLGGCLQHGRDLVCGREAPTQPRQLVLISPDRRQIVPLFDPNPEFAALRIAPTRRFEVHAEDGAPSYADLALPPGHRPGDRHPLIVVQYNSRGFLRGGTGGEYPAFALAARGYAVLSYQRPQSFAYGSEARDLNAFVRRNLADRADRRRAFTAMEHAVDAAIATGAIDAEHIGITGLSDGVATVQWALLHSRRYRAAAISSCCEDPASSSYMVGPAYTDDLRHWGYPRPGDPAAQFWGPYSLAVNAERVDVPILAQLTDYEYRFGLETFTRLRDSGKPIEMYVFPGEYHVKWQPRHRLAVYERAQDWFDFWLLGRDSSTPAKADQYRRWRALRAPPAPQH